MQTLDSATLCAFAPPFPAARLFEGLEGWGLAAELLLVAGPTQLAQACVTVLLLLLLMMMMLLLTLAGDGGDAHPVSASRRRTPRCYATVCYAMLC